MALPEGMDQFSPTFDKWISQLSKMSGFVDNMSKKMPGMSDAMAGAVAATPSKMSTSPAGFGMPSASFGGSGGGTGTTTMAAASFGPSGGKTDWKGLGLGALAIGATVGEAAWNLTPGADDAYTLRQSMFPAAMFGNTPGYDKNAFGKIESAFGYGGYSMFDQTTAASMLQMGGITVGSQNFKDTAGTAGFMSKMTGMSLTQASQGMMALQSGPAGVTGKLASVGIFTNDLGNGSFNGLGSVVDQLWERWYGSKNAKVDKIKFDAGMLGGNLARDLQLLFGDQPELLNQVKYALQLKQKAGGAAGIDYSETAKGPMAAKNLASKYGMNEMTNPQQKTGEVFASMAANVNSASEDLISGLNASKDQFIAFNNWMKDLNETGPEIVDLFNTFKGWLQGIMATSLGSALGGIVGAVGGAVGTGLMSYAAGKAGAKSVTKNMTTSTSTKTSSPSHSTNRPASGRSGTRTPTTPGQRVPTPQAHTPTTSNWQTTRQSGPTAGRPLPRGASAAAGAGVGMLFAPAVADATKTAVANSMGIPLERLDPNQIIDNGGGDVYFPGPGGSSAGSFRSYPDDPEQNVWGWYMWYKSVSGGKEPTRADFMAAQQQYGLNFGGKNFDTIANDYGIFGEGKGSTKTLNRDASTAVNWAANKAGNRGKKWKGLCDRFVANAYGQPHSGYASAKVHWASTPERYRRPGDENPPVGALVYWSNGTYGHVAIVTGTKDGEPIVTTTHTNGGTPTEMSLSTATSQLGGKGVYYGWAEPYFQGRIAELSGAQAAANATASTVEEAEPEQSPFGKPADIMLTNYDRDSLSSPMNTGLSANTILGDGGNESDSPVTRSGEGKNPTSTSSTNVGSRETPGGAPQTNRKPHAVKGGEMRLLKWLRGAGFEGEKLREAWAIGMRESSGSPTAHNTTPPDDSYGLFQINMLGGLGPERDAKFRKYVKGYNGYDSLFDPQVNIRAMRYMSAKGSNWASWVSPQFGEAAQHYQDFPDVARKAGIPGYSQGIEYVSKDQVAQLHAGNMVIPADVGSDFREAIREMKHGRSANVNITLKIEKASDEEAQRFAKKVISLLKEDERMERKRAR